MADADVKDRILTTFSEVASSLGYSPLHGKIIGVLLVRGEPVSLQELARETRYSVSMLSLSLDLLELLGVVRKVKRTGDRKLYIQLHGDLLECLKKAVIMKVQKSIEQSFQEFGQSRERLDGMDGKEKERALETLNILEKELKRLEIYINMLSKIRLP